MTDKKMHIKLERLRDRLDTAWRNRDLNAPNSSLAEARIIVDDLLAAAPDDGQAEQNAAAKQDLPETPSIHDPAGKPAAIMTERSSATAAAPGATPRTEFQQLYDAVFPFVKVIATTSRRIPTECLSFADWHELCKAFNLCTPVVALRATSSSAGATLSADRGKEK